MAKTTDEAFRIFHSRLTPTGGESDAAKNHRASIEQCLKANFGMSRFFRTGSFGNGTSIRGHSDVDYFAVIPTDKLKQDSSSTLIQVRDALAGRFPLTKVTIDSPAVRVPFGLNGSESTEIVPADLVSVDRYDNRTYDIPAPGGAWMRSAPDFHNAYVAAQDERLGNGVKPLVRFIKAWKYFRNVPISSFYLELYVARYAEQEKSILYSIDVDIIFTQLHLYQLPSFTDPMGVSGAITACSNENRRKVALDKLADAVRRADNARKAENEGEMSDAFYWWGMVYDGKFPAYG